MSMTFVCQACEDSFDVDFLQLTEDTRAVRCPGCDKRLSSTDARQLSEALDALFSELAGWRKKFAVTIDIDSEDLPPPYDSPRRGRGRDETGDDEGSDEEFGGDMEEGYDEE